MEESDPILYLGQKHKLTIIVAVIVHWPNLLTVVAWKLSVKNFEPRKFHVEVGRDIEVVQVKEPTHGLVDRLTCMVSQDGKAFIKSQTFTGILG